MKKQWFPCIRGIGEITEEPNCVLCTKLVSLREGLYIDATKVTRVWVHYDRNGARRPCGTFRVAVLMDLADGKQTAFNSSTFRFEAQANEAAASVLREINKIRSFNGLKDVEATNDLRNLETLLKFSGDKETEDESHETKDSPCPNIFVRGIERFCDWIASFPNPVVRTTLLYTIIFPIVYVAISMLFRLIAFCFN